MGLVLVDIRHFGVGVPVLTTAVRGMVSLTRRDGRWWNASCCQRGGLWSRSSCQRGDAVNVEFFPHRWQSSCQRGSFPQGPVVLFILTTYCGSTTSSGKGWIRMVTGCRCESGNDWTTRSGDWIRVGGCVNVQFHASCDPATSAASETKCKEMIARIEFC